jgi:hypothetical protein
MCDLGLRPTEIFRCAVRGWGLHYSRLLVYSINIIRESRSDVGPCGIDTFVGIRPADAPGFVIAQLVGATAATALFRWLVPSLPDDAEKVIVPHVRSESTHVG